ncbi:sugar phosphate isomerase/epimerase family protein [Paenibacillus humicola]|uniref:sugar phosphate isomerase/epimerase family protein n=1 Tax=Paenibacillus humicola TaxID=3110540 RepID=UPI00237A22BE|nr:sugar phosphate isomerase/epimerase family protein [Paenibacillus humicola]
MKTALSIWSCHKYIQNGTWTNADFIDFAKSIGAEGVELLSMFWKPDADIPAVEAALERTGLALACFGACNNLAVSDAAKREEQVQDIVRSTDMAVRFGAPVVRVFAGDLHAGVDYEQAKAWIIEGLSRGAAYAEERGVTLCLENHGLLAGKIGQVRDIIDSVGSPALRSTFDMGNFLLVGEQPADAAEQLAPLIGHVHVKDFKQTDEGGYKSLSGDRYIGTVPGEGDVGAAALLARFKASGYEGWLSVEYEGSDEQRDGSARAVRFVNEHR